ncbi:hypothetical protein HHI36_022655 [Cryptolaemus montrouzieri]|uniref:Uncharacterized protein n=1 Tax=Cryptolaemus montrouzieri TaxID=559131 RepID=A0ABD2N1I1_9CUCU
MASARITFYSNQEKNPDGEKWVCDNCNTGNRSVMEGDPPNSTENYTINDAMKKLFAIEGRFQKIDRQYKDLLQKYNNQLSVDNKLTNEINQIKCKLGKEINENAQSLFSENIILKGITKENDREDLKRLFKLWQIIWTYH